MEIEIINLTEKKIDTTDITNIINLTSKKLKTKEYLISIVLTDNEKIREINKIYRNIDNYTDVISFAFLDNDKNPDNEITTLGEIYISLEKALSQSIEYNHSFRRELCFLTVHGLLHLLGYDHMNKEDEEKMFKLQEEILTIYGVERWKKNY